MDWPFFIYHSKGRPRRNGINRTKSKWSLTYLTLLHLHVLLLLIGVGFLDTTNTIRIVNADSSPPVADVEDLFKDEGFLRMSRGGEAFSFGRRPPPPILPISIPSQPPPPHRPNFPIPPRDNNRNNSQQPKIPHGLDKNGNVNNRTGSGSAIASGFGGSGGQGVNSASQEKGVNGPKPLEKDVNAVFSKVNSEGSGTGQGQGQDNSDAHPLLGITPAAPGSVFDFSPILANPAVTRILAGSSGRVPQWEPTLDLQEFIPEVNNYTAGDNRGNGNGNSNSNSMATAGNGNTNTNGQGIQQQPHNPKNPVFVPSPVSSISKGSPTMYNMDQMTNNIAIPKHTLPNPSNLATSRTTITSEDSDFYGEERDRDRDRDRDNINNNNNGDGHYDDRYNPNGGNGGSSSSGGSSSNHYDDGRGGGGGNNPYVYDDDSRGDGDENGGGGGRNYLNSNSNSEAQAGGKRGSYKGDNGQDHGAESHLENGPKYIVCDALCGAWKHQCKLMGILFSITSVLCLLFAFAVLYSLQFQFQDFVPFSIILLFLFGTSASRAFILLSESFCSPTSRPSWLPIVSTLPPGFFTIAILVCLRLARFPFPFIKSYTISPCIILIISILAVVPPLGLSIGAHLHPPSHAILSQVAWITSHVVVALISLLYLFKFRPFYARLSNERGTNNSSSNSSSSAATTTTNGNHNHIHHQQLNVNMMNMGTGAGTGSGTPTGPNNMMGNGHSTIGNGHFLQHNNYGVGSGSSSNLNLNLNLNLNSGLQKKRGFVVNWGCLQARAMFGVALFVLSLSTMIIISVAMSRGECEFSSESWSGWVLSLCARMLEFAIVILLLLVTISSADVRFLSRLTRVPINKSNVGLMNADIFPTMVSSNTAVQRCIIPMYSSNRADVMMLGPTNGGPTESPLRSSLRGKTFGERTLPGERLGEYRSSVGRNLPLRLGNGMSGMNGMNMNMNPPPSTIHSLPGTPLDFPQGLRLPEPAPASLLVTKVVFGTPAVSREVNLNHQHENPLLCTTGRGHGHGHGVGGGLSSSSMKDIDRETNNIYASLESVKIASSMVNAAGSSTGSTGSDRVLLSAPRDYIYSISRDLANAKNSTIDSIYDTSSSSRPRSSNLPHNIEALCPPMDQIGSIPNLNGSHHNNRGGGNGFNFHHPHTFHHHQQQQQNNSGGGNNQNNYHNNNNNNPGRTTDLARTIDRLRYAASTVPSNALNNSNNNSGNQHNNNINNNSHNHNHPPPPGRNFVLQLGNNHNNNSNGNNNMNNISSNNSTHNTSSMSHNSSSNTNLPGMGNPPPYCSSESSHDVTPDSGIVSDIHSKSGRMEIPEVVYAREYRRNSVEDVRRIPLLPIPKQRSISNNNSSANNTPGSTPLYDHRTPSILSPTTPPQHNSTPNTSIVGRVEHLLNQTESILSRTESLDSNSNSAGLQRLLSHKEQLEHVERLLAQAEYAIAIEKKNCAQQVSQLSPSEANSPCSYSVYSSGSTNGHIHGHSHSHGINNTSISSNNSNNSAVMLQQQLRQQQQQLQNGVNNTSVNNTTMLSSSSPSSSSFPQFNSANSANNRKDNSSNNHNNPSGNNSSMVVKNHCNSGSNNNNSGNNNNNSSSSSSNSANNNNNNNISNHNGSVNGIGHYTKKMSKNLEEESVV